MAKTKTEKRALRAFTDFKQGAVRLVLDEGRSVTDVARILDLRVSALRTWVVHARPDQTKGDALFRFIDGPVVPIDNSPAQRGF